MRAQILFRSVAGTEVEVASGGAGSSFAYIPASGSYRFIIADESGNGICASDSSSSGSGSQV